MIESEKMTFEDCWKRVSSATEIKRYNKLAEVLGIQPSSVNGAKKRDMFPPKWAVILGEKYGLSVEWILTGKGNQNVVEDGAEAYLPGKSKFIDVPIYDVKVSAGHGNMIHSEEVQDHLAFQRSWVIERGLKEGFLALVKVDGDSMVPTLLDGDLILIDRAVIKFRGDALYVLNFDGDIKVKRIQKQPNGDLVIQSDNPAYKPFTVSKEEADTITIIGRVVWFGRNI